MSRKKNPVHSSGKKFTYRKKDGIRVPTKVLTSKRERKEFSKTADYLIRVEKMRPYFGDTFRPSAGFDMRNVDAWTPAQKRKVTKYFRVMAPRIGGGDMVIKRYRRKDHLANAIDASLQESRLPGQTAAIFSVDADQKLEISFTRQHRVVVKRGGIIDDTILFNKNAFLRDWKAEVNNALSQTDAKIFKVITGANKTEKTFTRGELIKEIARMVEGYGIDKIGKVDFDDRFFGEWLNGIIGYKGVTMQEMKRISHSHTESVNLRRAEHFAWLQKKRKIYSRRQLLKGRK